MEKLPENRQLNSMKNPQLGELLKKFINDEIEYNDDSERCYETLLRIIAGRLTVMKK